MAHYTSDLMALAGIFLVGFGAWQYSPALACVIVGAILITISVGGTLYKAAKQ